MLDAFLVGFGPWGWPLGSQMVNLECQDTDWMGGNERFLDAILLRDGIILGTLSMDKGKWVSWVHFWVVYGYHWCISGWFGASRVALKIIEGWLRVSGNRLGRWKWGGFRCVFTARRLHTSHSEHKQRKMWLSRVHFWMVYGSKGGPLGPRWLT